MSHDELTGLAAGYALSALDENELKSFEAHLASCPECQASVSELRVIIDGFSMMTDEVEPSAALRERILASALAERRNRASAAAVTPEKRSPWWRRPVLWPLPVAMVVMVLAIAVAVVSVWGSQADNDLSSAQRRLNLSYDGLEIMAQADQWWRFSGSDIASAAAGSLAYSNETGTACLLVWGLPEGDQTVYQAHITDGEGQESVRKMWRYDNAMWLILDGDPSQLQKLEVTMSTGDSTAASGTTAIIEIPLS
jgi:hypothetical protein